METYSTSRGMAPLNGTNYLTWSVRIKARLQLAGTKVAKAIEGRSRATAPASASATSSAGVKMEVKDVTEEERMAYAIVVQCLDDERLQMMQSVAEHDAAGLWAEIVRINESVSIVSKMHTREMLYAARMGRDSFDVYRTRVMQLVMRLRSMGSVVGDDELIYVVLSGLSDEYDQLRASLEVKNDLTFEEMCEHVRSRQQRLAHAGDATVREHESAMYARSTGRGGTGGRRDTNSEDRPLEADHRCRLCTKKGHWEQYCELRKGRGVRDACYRCGGAGHQMRDCTVRGSPAESPVMALATFCVYPDTDEEVPGY